MLASYVIGQSDFTSDVQVTNQSGLRSFSKVTYDSVGSLLFATDAANSRVMVFDLSGGLSNGMLASFVLGQSDFSTSATATNQSGMYFPTGVAYDETDRLFFVSDYANHRILVFNLSGGISNGMLASYVLGQSDFVSSALATNQSGLKYPFGLDYDSPSQRLFVVDYLNNRVLVFDFSSGISNGMLASYVLGQSDFSTSATATNQSGFKYPNDIDYDSIGERLFVSDPGNYRVLVFDLSSGISNGMLASYVIGQPDFTTVSKDTTQSLTYSAYGIDFDDVQNYLFITSGASSNRVLVFNMTGGITNGMAATYVLGQSDFTTNTSAHNQSGMNNTLDAFFDSANRRIFVGESFNRRILVFNNTVYGLGAPNASTFASDTTDFQVEPDCEAVPQPKLVKGGSRVRWPGTLNVTKRDFDNQLKLGSQFISQNISSLGTQFNTSANVSISGVNCQVFSLYYAPSFHQSLASLVAAGAVVATQANLGGDCTDPAICTNLRCANGVLNFTALHFDGFGDGGPGAGVPEFSFFTVMLGVCGVLLGFFLMRRREK